MNSLMMICRSTHDGDDVLSVYRSRVISLGHKTLLFLQNGTKMFDVFGYRALQVHLVRLEYQDLLAKG